MTVPKFEVTTSGPPAENSRTRWADVWAAVRASAPGEYVTLTVETPNEVKSLRAGAYFHGFVMSGRGLKVWLSNKPMA